MHVIASYDDDSDDHPEMPDLRVIYGGAEHFGAESMLSSKSIAMSEDHVESSQKGGGLAPFPEG